LSGRPRERGALEPRDGAGADLPALGGDDGIARGVGIRDGLACGVGIREGDGVARGEDCGIARGVDRSTRVGVACRGGGLDAGRLSGDTRGASRDGVAWTGGR